MRKFVWPVMLTCLIACFAIWFYEDFYLSEIVRVNADKQADFLVISKDVRDNPKPCMVITDKNTIENYLSAYQWHSIHLYCEVDSDYTVEMIDKDTLSESIYYQNDSDQLYNTGFIKKTKSFVNNYRGSADLSFQYTFSAPITVDYDTLKPMLIQNENFRVYCKAEETTPKYAYIELTYKDYETNYPQWNDNSEVTKAHPLGEFEPDNVFVPMVNAIKNDGLFKKNTDPRFSGGGGQEHFFVRRMLVYLNRQLDEENVERYKSVWSGTFQYRVPENYRFFVVANHKLSESEMESLYSKYNLTIQSN